MQAGEEPEPCWVELLDDRLLGQIFVLAGMDEWCAPQRPLRCALPPPPLPPPTPLPPSLCCPTPAHHAPPTIIPAPSSCTNCPHCLPFHLRRQCQAVCRRWRRIWFSEPGLWRTLCLRPTPDACEQLAVLQRVAPLVEALEL